MPQSRRRLISRSACGTTQQAPRAGGEAGGSDSRARAARPPRCRSPVGARESPTPGGRAEDCALSECCSRRETGCRSPIVCRPSLVPQALARRVSWESSPLQPPAGQAPELHDAEVPQGIALMSASRYTTWLARAVDMGASRRASLPELSPSRLRLVRGPAPPSPRASSPSRASSRPTSSASCEIERVRNRRPPAASPGESALHGVSARLRLATSSVEVLGVQHGTLCCRERSPSPSQKVFVLPFPR